MSLFVILLVIKLSFAGLENPLKSDFIDFSNLNLNRYIQPRDGFVVEKMNSQEDPNLVVYFVFEKKINEIERRLAIQVFDYNKDSKMDSALHIRNGKVFKREFASDYDGKVNQVVEYDVTTGKPIKETSLDGGNNRNIWRYWHNGELRLMEMDRNNDRKPDKWVHYRKEKVVKTEVDANFDGKQIKEVK